MAKTQGNERGFFMFTWKNHKLSCVFAASICLFVNISKSHAQIRAAISSAKHLRTYFLWADICRYGNLNTHTHTHTHFQNDEDFDGAY